MNVNLKEHYGLYIGGKFVPASDGAEFETTNPATGVHLAYCAEATWEDVDAAVNAAWKAFPAWKKVDPIQRAEILNKIADRIDENAELLATVETLDNGKPIRETMAIDVPLSARITSAILPAAITHRAGQRQRFWTAAISAWCSGSPSACWGRLYRGTSPSCMAAWKLAPVLASG